MADTEENTAPDAQEPQEQSAEDGAKGEDAPEATGQNEESQETQQGQEEADGEAGESVQQPNSADNIDGAGDVAEAEVTEEDGGQQQAATEEERQPTPAAAVAAEDSPQEEPAAADEAESAPQPEPEQAAQAEAEAEVNQQPEPEGQQQQQEEQQQPRTPTPAASAEVKMSEEQMNRCHHYFDRSAVSGRLDLKGFKLLFRLMGEVLSAEDAGRMFEGGNRDGNETIDFEEFCRLYCCHSQEEHSRKAAMMDSIDKLFPGMDGQPVELKKVKNLLLKMQRPDLDMRLVREKSDLNPGDIHRLVKSMDTTGSGLVSKQEFVDTLCKHLDHV